MSPLIIKEAFTIEVSMDVCRKLFFFLSSDLIEIEVALEEVTSNHSTNNPKEVSTTTFDKIANFSPIREICRGSSFAHLRRINADR